MMNKRSGFFPFGRNVFGFRRVHFPILPGILLGLVLAGPARAGQSDAPRFDLFRHLGTQPSYSADWPVTKDGLVFLWKNHHESPAFKNLRGEDRVTKLRTKGGAEWGPRGEMKTPKGLFHPSKEVAGEIRAACMATNQLGVEAVVTPSRSPQSGPARIISFSKGLGHRNFTLGQEGGELIFRLQTSATLANGAQYRLAPLLPENPQHVIVTYRPGLLVCYVNGELASRFEIPRGSFDHWKEYELYFGRERGGRRKWEGRLEGIAIYNRFISEREARRKYDIVSREFGLEPKP